MATIEKQNIVFATLTANETEALYHLLGGLSEDEWEKAIKTCNANLTIPKLKAHAEVINKLFDQLYKAFNSGT